MERVPQSLVREGNTFNTNSKIVQKVLGQIDRLPEKEDETKTLMYTFQEKKWHVH